MSDVYHILGNCKGYGMVNGNIKMIIKKNAKRSK